MDYRILEAITDDSGNWHDSVERGRVEACSPKEALRTFADRAGLDITIDAEQDGRGVAHCGASIYHAAEPGDEVWR